jgi:hypothetical protein
MGLIDNLLKALRREPTDVDRDYTASTIRTGDEVNNTQSSQNPKDFTRVGRALAGSVYNAATLVAPKVRHAKLEGDEREQGRGHRASDGTSRT